MFRPRVLLLAEHCNPEWASLPVVGYNAARAIADVADVTLVTHARNEPALSRTGLGAAKSIAYVDNEFIARPMYGFAQRLRGGGSVGWTTSIAMSYLPYVIFEKLVWKRFGAAIRTGEFDVVHRLTPMSPTIPSPIAKKCSVPFVLGPLNGGLKWPAGFGAELRREREWMTYLRNGYRMLPYARSTYRRAAAILAAFDHTVADIPEWARSRTIDLAEVGVNPAQFHANDAPRAEATTFLYAGRLVPYKCPDVAVEAFVGSEALASSRLVIVGDGPEMPALRAIVERHGAQDRVKFAGWKTQTEVGEIMRRAHVFVFPSIRELGAGVLVEAMACGLCCLVVDYGAPGGLIDGSRGAKVPLTDKETLIRNVRAEMERLATDRPLVASLGAEARRFALAEYSWEAKAKKVLEVYRWVLKERDKPSFR